MDRLYILDGHGYIFRAHFGLMTAGKGDRREIRLSNSEGMPTGALFVFARMLLRMALDRKPAHIAVVFDAGRKNFRSELYPDYKAHRPPTPEDLAIQLPYFRKIPEAMGWKVLSVEGVEADDVIATLVADAKRKQIPVTILSADKDLMQLVGDGVEMHDSLSQRTYQRGDVIEKFGVPPERVAEFLALVGDTSDNVPGLDGVGDKTAAKLLAEYGSIDALIKANPVVPRIKVKQPFSDPASLARLEISRKLVALRDDVALGITLDDLHAQKPVEAELNDLFATLEFAAIGEKFLAQSRGDGTASNQESFATQPVTTALARSPASETASERQLPQPVSDPIVTSDRVAIATSSAAIEELAAACLAAKSVAILPVFDDQRDDNTRLVGIGMCPLAGAPVYVPIAHRYLVAPQIEANAREVLHSVFANDQIAKVIFDSKRFRKALLRAGIALQGELEDSMIAAFVADPTVHVEDLAVVAGAEGGVAAPSLTTLLTRHAHSYAEVAVETLAPIVCRQAEVLHELNRRLIARMQPAAEKLYREVELPIAALLATVEEVGIRIDAKHFAELDQELSAQLKVLEQKIFEHARESFNIGSPKQLGSILFEKLGLTSDRMKKTKTGFSTDAEVLEAMIETHPIIPLVLDQRELSKLKSTYIDALPPLVNPRTGRIHTTFNMVAAATGRLSSQDPNLQNIPIRSEWGRKIRRGFVASEGKVLLAADYSQIELRILAHLSQDPVLVRAFRDRIDVHTQTACEVFGIEPSQVESYHRRVAKAVNYGLIYGQSDFGLARALDITRSQAATYSARYFEKFPSIRAYLASVVSKAKADGGTTTILGRWRPIKELGSKTTVARRAAERIAQNTPMQGAGADIMKVAMLACQRLIASEKSSAQMLLTVHDELVFELNPNEAQDFGKKVAQTMADAVKLSVPLEVDIGIASNWADA